jgi:hypothetical protein
MTAMMSAMTAIVRVFMGPPVGWWVRFAAVVPDPARI